jgi:DNA-binding SARP family transcriptional activator/streptogramin lyase
VRGVTIGLVHFSVLGPIEVRSASGAGLELGGPKQRAVLALLVVSANRVVRIEQLIDEVWPDGEVRSGRKSVQAYVARLRRVFALHGADDVLHARAGGYVLEAEPEAIDAARFERDVRRARTMMPSDPEAAALLLRECLALWRGRPFEDAHPTRGLEAEAHRMEEHHMSVVEDLADADLACGRHADVVAELEVWARSYPHRERLWELLMVALYRCGRQADALARYRELRVFLDDQLGVEPGPAVRELERRILTHDAAIAFPPRVRRSAEPPGKRSRPGTVAIVVAGVGVALAVLVGVLVAVLVRARDNGGLEVAARYPVPNGATEVVAAGSALWVLDPEGSALTSVDPKTGRTGVVRLADAPTAIAAGRGRIWVASAAAGSLTEIDAVSGRVLARRDSIDLDGASLALGPHDLWIVREAPRAFARVGEDDLDVEVLDSDEGTPVAPDIAVGSGRLWASNGEIGRVLALDPSSGSSALRGEPLLGQHGVLSVAYDRGAVWYSQPTHGSVTHLDASTGAVVATVSIGPSRDPQFIRGITPYALAGGPGGFWVTQPDQGRVLLLNEATGAVRARARLDEPVALAAAGGSMWVLDRGTAELVRIDGPGCDEAPFVGPEADLRACELARSVFAGVDLSGADLRWADLHSSLLQRADFTDADLLGANLQGSTLDHATWHNTRCPDGSLSDSHHATCANNLVP